MKEIIVPVVSSILIGVCTWLLYQIIIEADWLSIKCWVKYHVGIISACILWTMQCGDKGYYVCWKKGDEIYKSFTLEPVRDNDWY